LDLPFDGNNGWLQISRGTPHRVVKQERDITKGTNQAIDGHCVFLIGGRCMASKVRGIQIVHKKGQIIVYEPEF